MFKKDIIKYTYTIKRSQSAQTLRFELSTGFVAFNFPNGASTCLVTTLLGACGCSMCPFFGSGVPENPIKI